MPELLVNVDIDDLDRAVAFYCAAFGLIVARRFGTGAVELLGASAPIHLLVKPPGSPAWPGGDERRDYRRHWTPVHLDFVVDDLAAAITRAAAAGARLEAPVRAAEWGDLTLMSDPFGHGFCLVEFRGRGYDAIADPS